MPNIVRVVTLLGILLLSGAIWQTYYISDLSEDVFRVPIVTHTRPLSRTLLGSKIVSHTTKETTRQHPLNGSIPDLVKLRLDDFTGSLENFDTGEKTKHTDEWSDVNQLIPGLVPSIVHFAWCGEKRWFEFKHYLSVQSVIRSMNPDKIVIHYQNLPAKDKLFYYQWFDNLKHDFPFLHLEPLADEQLVVCNPDDPKGRKKVILDFLKKDGGIYVGENTWLINFPAAYRQIDFDMSLEEATEDGYVILRKGVLENRTYESVLNDSSLRTRQSNCATVSQFYNVYHSVRCIIVKGGRYDHFLPRHIWESDDLFVRLCRKIFYGTERVLKPQPSYDELVPNIGHMIWLGGGEMDFVFYLSALSVLYVLKVDNLYIHGDQPPKGPYWEKLKENKRIKCITRPEPHMIYQGEIEWYFRALMSDLIRVDIMIKYGGIYTDTDAIWVQPLSYEERGYEAVASFDWVDWSYPYPDSVNFGLSYGKKNAPFWRIFRDSMRELHNDVHGFSGVMMPYKLLEKYPHLLKIDPHLQVICYQFRCHPTYVKDYHNMGRDHITDHSIPNWKKDVHAFHWTHPNPKEYANETTLLAATGLFADIGKFVLKEAGLL